MTDCYNQVPWFTLLDTTASDSVSASVGECPVDPPVRLVLSFVKMTFTTQKTVVTSLQPGVNEPLSFVNCDGTAATTGDLYAKLTVAPLIDPTVVRGGLVMKEIVNSQLAFRRGWVAEAVYAGSDAIVLSGSHQERLNPAAPLSPTNPLLHQGIVKLDVQLDPADRELNPQVVLLSDALEREYKGVTYLGFASGRDSAINARFNVPPTGLPANPRLTIRGLLFGRAVGPFAAMQMRYARLVRPTAGTPTPVTDSTTTITFDVVTPSDNYDGNGTNLPADRAIEVSSETFVVSPGDTIFITLSRAKTATPLFQADIGLIRLSAVVTGG